MLRRHRREGSPLSSAIPIFTSAEQQVFARSEIECALMQMRSAYQMSLPAGKLAFS